MAKEGCLCGPVNVVKCSGVGPFGMLDDVVVKVLSVGVNAKRIMEIASDEFPINNE